MIGANTFESSAHGGLHDGSERLKKAANKRRDSRVGPDEILPEYDFSGAARNKYASRYAAGSTVVVLEPDVAAAFPNSEEANEALRALAAMIQKHGSRKHGSRRGLLAKGRPGAG